ncbi:MAG: hypothetical protein K6G83_05890 [Lachnospiraceae bacterium]|nr:hypothetical protein [Lachnospiraceae bacterium]
MKAVVISIDNDKATILGKDGLISRIENRDYHVGDELKIELLEKKGLGNKVSSIASRLSKNAVRIAAAALVMIIGAGSVTVYAMPASTVTVDINPSLEYRVNLFNRVVAVSSYNDDGSDLLNAMSGQLTNKKLDAAIDLTLDALEEADYIKEETSIVITVDSKVADTKKLETKVMDSMTQWNEKKQSEGKNVSVAAEALEVTDDMRAEAAEKHESPAKAYMDEKKKAEEKAQAEAIAQAEADAQAAALLQAQLDLINNMTSQTTPAPAVEQSSPSSGSSSSDDSSGSEPEQAPAVEQQPAPEQAPAANNNNNNNKKKKKNADTENKEEGKKNEEAASETDPPVTVAIGDPAIAQEGTAATPTPTPGVTPEAGDPAIPETIQVPVVNPDGTVTLVTVPNPAATASPTPDPTATVIPDPTAIIPVPTVVTPTDTPVPTEPPVEEVTPVPTVEPEQTITPEVTSVPTTDPGKTDSTESQLTVSQGNEESISMDNE